MIFLVNLAIKLNVSITAGSIDRIVATRLSLKRKLFDLDFGFRLKSVGLPSPGGRAQRRESFLYRQQVSFTPDREEEEQIVTPFAQILATLKEVRNNLSFVLSAGGEPVRRSNLYKTESMLSW